MAVKFKIQFLFLGLLIILMLIFPSALKAEKTFRFGTWTYGGKGSYPSHDTLMNALADTLKFNYLMDNSWNSERFQAIEQETLRIAAQNLGRGFTHQGPYYYSFSHYNIWEGEGNEAYTESLNLHHPAGIGTTVVDGAVISYKVRAGVDPETLIQFGPRYYAQDLGYGGLPVDAAKPYYPYIDYNASYRVRVGTDQDPGSNEAVAILYVAKVKYDDSVIVDIVDIDTLWDDHFPDSVNYIEHTLTWNTIHFDTSHGWYAESPNDKVWGMELRVYWFGNRDFYIDKVTVYDEDGLRLMEGLADNEIYNHIHTYHQNSPSLDAWYMREEMHSLGDEVDCVKPWAYLSSYLADQGDKYAVGSMHTPGHVQDFVDLVNPKELWIHTYVLKGNHAYSSDYQGPDSLSLQVAWDNLTDILDQYNNMCEQDSIYYTSTLQGFSDRRRFAGENDTIRNPDDTLTWYWSARGPTGYELECMTNLAIAHGSKGVLYWKYWDGYYRKDTVWVWNGSNYDTVTNYIHSIITGLVDDLCNATERWYWIRDKIGPYIDSLGETYYDLNWLGAGSSDGVDTISGSFINDIQSLEYQDSAYIEVAFFDSGNTDYFMLTNRRCLPDESQNVTSYINKGGTYKIVDLYEDDTTLAGHLDTVSAIPFTTHLEPGEGKLFKLIRK